MTSNGKERKKETEKGEAMLLTNNGKDSRKGIEKGGTILLTSREQGKIDAELAKSGEEESEKQQGETGVV